MNDSEREAYISLCAKRMEEAMAQGQRHIADGWRIDMEHHINQRSPEQIQRMEVARGLSEPCYFAEMGEKDRQALPALLRRQAA